MASANGVGARAAPKPDQTPPSVDWGSTPVATLLTGERRLEASTYLSDGYGRRLSIEARSAGWQPVSEVANVWQPSRLKGIVLPEGTGTPFLSAGQVYERTPTTRKWLSPERTPGLQLRYVNSGTIMLTCSGTVGRATVAHRPHNGHVITHDLLRIEPHDQHLRGWTYAFMRTAAFRSMAVSSHYGHVIKHLEPSHVAALPIVMPPPHETEGFQASFARIFSARDEAWSLIEEAHRLYASALAPELGIGPPADEPFSISVREVLTGRRRLDAYHRNRTVQRVEEAMRRNSRAVASLPEVTRRIWWPNRFRRVFGAGGTPYVSAEELFDLNPPVTKRIHEGLVEDPQSYHVSPGWLLMARSGQVYGLNGRVLMASDRHSDYFVSEDLIRVIPDDEAIRPGYLEVTLSHPTLGRPLIIRQAYGTSIPHLEPDDVALVAVPRLDPGLEDDIAEVVERAALLRSEADLLEDASTERAEAILHAFTRAEGEVIG